MLAVAKRNTKASMNRRTNPGTITGAFPERLSSPGTLKTPQTSIVPATAKKE